MTETISIRRQLEDLGAHVNCYFPEEYADSDFADRICRRIEERIEHLEDLREQVLELVLLDQQRTS